MNGRRQRKDPDRGTQRSRASIKTVDAARTRKRNITTQTQRTVTGDGEDTAGTHSTGEEAKQTTRDRQNDERHNGGDTTQTTARAGHETRSKENTAHEQNQGGGPTQSRTTHTAASDANVLRRDD